MRPLTFSSWLNHALPTVNRRSASSRVSLLSSAKSCVPPIVLPETSQYSAGAKRLRNFIIQKYGGASFRPGFRYVGEVDDTGTTPRYLPFQYNVEQAYIMVLDDEALTLLANGGVVVEPVTAAAPGSDMLITAITRAANAQVTAAFHDYAVGDKVFFSGIAGMTEINGRFASVVSVVDADNFTIDLDTTGFTAFVSSTGVARVGAPAPIVPPAPPPVPPALPEPPITGGGGGSGSDLGEGEYRYDDGTLR